MGDVAPGWAQGSQCLAVHYPRLDMAGAGSGLVPGAAEPPAPCAGGWLWFPPGAGAASSPALLCVVGMDPLPSGTEGAPLCSTPWCEAGMELCQSHPKHFPFPVLGEMRR